MRTAALLLTFITLPALAMDSLHGIRVGQPASDIPDIEDFRGEPDTAKKPGYVSKCSAFIYEWRGRTLARPVTFKRRFSSRRGIDRRVQIWPLADGSVGKVRYWHSDFLGATVADYIADQKTKYPKFTKFEPHENKPGATFWYTTPAVVLGERLNVPISVNIYETLDPGRKGVTYSAESHMEHPGDPQLKTVLVDKAEASALDCARRHQPHLFERSTTLP